MIGEKSHHCPTVQVPQWALQDDPTNNIFSPSPKGSANFNTDDISAYFQPEALAALQRYFPSNSNDSDFDLYGDVSAKDVDFRVDAYSCDHFRMFEFKVRKCSVGRSHDWTECPFAHPGEKARRRDPRKYHYSGAACPEFRKGNCKKGEACEFAHGVFECWLHPSRYRTQPCKDGLNCRRRVCFFAHTLEQLRILSPKADSYEVCQGLPFLSSPESVSPPTESPPLSPMTTNSLSRSLGSSSINEMVASLRQLRLNNMKPTPSSWGLQVGSLGFSPGFGSPRNPIIRPGFCSLPSTPTKTFPRAGICVDIWDKSDCEEEPVMERVESGRDLRAKMFEKLSRENPLDRVVQNQSDIKKTDVGWVSELLK